ncbi:glycosyltransferase family 1 protein, partial [Bacteroides ovatus]
DFDRMPYVWKVPPDESPIDICGLINFQRSQQMSPPEIRETVRALSWTAQMRKVIHETEI